jgi:hypothetical protein
MIGSRSTSTKESKRLTTAGLIAVTAATLLMMGWAIFPTPAAATHVTPVEVNGNPTCNGVKFDPPNNGTINVPGFGSITVSAANGSTFNWSSTFGIDSVIVKGGPNANIYTYDPPSEAFGDSGLHAPVNPNNDQFFGLSHIEFCFDKDVTTTTTTVPTTTTTVPTTTTTVPTTTTTVPTTTTTTVTTTTTTVPGGGGGGGGGTTTVPVTTTTTPTVGPTTVQPSTTTKSPDVAPTTVSPRGTAFTGVENVVPIGAIALMLMTSGTGLLWAGSRRKRDQNQDEE